MQNLLSTFYSFCFQHFAPFLVFLFLLPIKDFAHGAGGGGGLQNPIKFRTLEDFLVAILDAVVLIVFPFLVLALVYAGFKFVMAQGKPEPLAEARRALLWVFIGALIVLGAKALSLAIQATVAEITTTMRDNMQHRHLT